MSVPATRAALAGITTLSRSGDVEYAAPMTESPTDAALMFRYRDGDVRAFEQLYRRHNDGLYRYLLRLSLNRATAEDLYQEAWSRIIKYRQQYRPTAKFTTYLYRIGHNCFIDFVRRNKRYATDLSIDPGEIVDSADTPEQATERQRFRARLFQALAQVPDEQRDVFLLHEEAGLSLDEIATTTGVNRETAKSRLRYANKKLRAALAETECTKSPGTAEPPAREAQ